MFERIPPQSIEAEQNMIGCLISDKDVLEDIFSITKASDCYRQDHKEIFEAIKDTYEKNMPIDIITVSEKLKKMGTLEQVGGLEYLMNISNGVPTTANASYYAKIVTTKAIIRDLIKGSMEIVNAGYEGKLDAEELLARAEMLIFNINKFQDTKNVVQFKECLIECLGDLEKRVQQKGSITGISTGFIDLDYKLAGLQNSDLILIAARPAMGKTAIAVNIAEYVGITKNIPVAIFSLEMSKAQLTNRILCSQTLIDSHKIKIGSLEDADWKRISDSLSVISDANIFIDDTPSINVSEIFSKCRKLKKNKGLGLVVIDYLQLMQGKSKIENRTQEISEISRSLKIMAKKLNVPVIALSQLSRAPEQRTDHRPILSDLRDSGSIEQDADVVMFLYRDDYYNSNSDKRNIAEVIIAKHRNGGTGTVELAWLAKYTKFSNLQRYKG